MNPWALFVISFFSLNAVTSAFNVTTIAFDEGYVPLFGEANLDKSYDGTAVKLILNRYSGSGFISSDMYQYGLFSASVKLPSDYTAGIVVAFYMSNGDVFKKNHDELDFEFLGNIWGKQWRVQTNIYGNGSTSRGREERYFLPFDPTKEFHRYSILWTTDEIIFFIDDTPIRYVKRAADMGGDYPAKPMSVYATIWDASTWATSGGKHRVNYQYGPFVSEFTDLALVGCKSDPIQEPSTAASEDQCSAADDEITGSGLANMTPEKRRRMLEFRERYMSYSACYDRLRYPNPPPGCDLVESEGARFKETGHVNFARRKRPARRRSSRRGGGGTANRKTQTQLL